MLKQTYLSLIGLYATDAALIKSGWKEIEENHSGPKRYYHTLKHLEHLFGRLSEVREEVKDWETLLCSIFYHDIVYDVSRGDNEEKSAETARERLQAFSFPADKIPGCVVQILATKGHHRQEDPDANFFIDADLSILGEPWEVYAEYMRNVRSEYSIYPDLTYNPGRLKVLGHFLDRKRIYQTEPFYERFEAQARENLKREMEILRS